MTSIGDSNSHSVPKSIAKKQRYFLNKSLLLGGSIAITTGLFSNPIQVLSNTCDCNNYNGICKCNSIKNERNEYNFNNERIYDTLHHSYLPAEPMRYLINDLNGRKVIAIGEVHSNPCHHKLEFEIVRSVGSLVGPQKLSIGMECFYRQHQSALDRYIFKHKNIGLLKRETNWDETWGYDLNYYAKILAYAVQNNIRIIGLNLPLQVAKLVSERGLNNMPKSLKKLLPTVDLTVEKHRLMFQNAMQMSGHNNNNNADNKVNNNLMQQYYYETQTLWDEYMAESASNYIIDHPDSTLIIIAGLGHIQGRVAIPDRINKRTNSSPFVIVPQQVDWSEESGLPLVAQPLTQSDCDWAWYTEKELNA
eukprot:gene8740-11810_t